MYVSYIFEITDWQPSYHLSINDGKLDDEPYWESATLQLIATCKHPQRFAGQKAAIDLAARRDLLRPKILEFDETWKPRAIGSLTSSADGLSFYGSIPHDTFSSVAALIGSGRVRYAILYGLEMKYRKSLCRSVNLERSINIDDYV